ncbi:hypothetical protein K505DRAFT_360000 [Melanomma pulvis-pyrius CBS 109.77]|uniref:DH domain-containing protein n=1 Tax=Melanomma pulvis-pyrius CBS 109.77 TaxID=1314802 RepID=A0A6A6XGF4_9PLEO|nr:hypothetical protein K505DRAFT_360000 [Melanomma pulvis-pyrius CBS 109.77]
MEIATAAFGIVGVLPQCISSAKDLYDLRSRYKDASVLITAIYSESMVIAASLSQLQGLLHQDALKNKPQLHETFDRALTGCRVVYVCLDEEVRELAQKADSDNLKFKDRTKYLWKEDTFKELLQQIRGQQSALSLLLQGLQMESIADIKRLVEDNSARLDQIATRSKTLRKSRPSIKVPDSIFKEGCDLQNNTDAQAVIRSAEFDFDDEIVNSTAYRRAMALATLQAEGKAPDTTEYITDEKNEDHEQTSSGDVDIASLELEPKSLIEERHSELLDSLEHSLLPFMPPTSSAAGAFSPQSPMSPTMPVLGSEFLEEMPPPLPPRRATRPPAESKGPEIPSEGRNSTLSDDSTSAFSAPSTFSKASSASSYTAFESSKNSMPATGSLQRKAHGPMRKTSYDTLFRTLSGDPEDVRLASSDEVEMHNVWTSLITDEQIFIDHMTNFRTTFYNHVIQQWPVLEKHLELIPMGEQLAALHRQYLLDVMKEQVAVESFATCDPSIFDVWAKKTQNLYRDYCQRLPHAKGAILMTQNMDSKFSPFVRTLGLDVTFSGKSWEDYLTLPISQLDLYIEKLRRLVKITLITATPSSKKNEPRLMRILDVVRRLKKSCLRIIEESRDREEIQNLHRRIHTLNADYLSRLNLLEPGRRILLQGKLAIKVHGQGAWHAVHVVQLDNYLFWGMVKPPRSKKPQEPKTKKNGNIWVLEAPLPIQEVEMRLPDKDHQYQKATILDDIPRGSVLYLLFVKDKTATVQPHMLGASSHTELEQWTAHLHAAIATRATRALN